MHTLWGLGADATLALLPLQAASLEVDAPSARIAELLADPRLPGVLLSERGQLRGLVSRKRFLELMSLPLSRDLFSMRPADSLLRHVPAEFLRFPANTTILNAAAHALQRPPESLGDPVVVSLPGEGERLLDMPQLLQAQARILEQITRLLNQRESALRALFQAMSDDVVIFDRDGRYHLIPGTRPRLLCASPNELRGKTIQQCLPEEADNFLRHIRACLARRETVGFEYQVEIAGEIRWFSGNFSPLQEDKVILVGHDITRRKRNQQALQAEREKSERLLLNVLPRRIAEQLKQTPGIIAEYFPEATILFADLVGFTPLSARLSPIEVVELLNRIFSGFDALARQYGLEKIKTIGDAYMVVGGLPEAHPDHVGAVADMALDMLRCIAELPGHGAPLQIRIGINTGPVVAGVIGSQKFSYDLWGDTVNIASRMESKGEPGHIQVTQAVYRRLAGAYLLQERGTVMVKGKGEMLTYWLLGKKG